MEKPPEVEVRLITGTAFPPNRVININLMGYNESERDTC
jgi:hypothetical protein